MKGESIKERILLWLIPVVGALLALTSTVSFATESEQGVFDGSGTSASRDIQRSEGRWGFAYENDFFVPGGRDQDYTYGLSFSYSSANISESKVHTPLSVLDSLLGIDDTGVSRLGYEGGLYGFTPEDITVSEPNSNDRPFASLVYFSTSKERVNAEEQSVLRSQISYGVLGLDIVGQVQEEFHRLIGNDEPRGWGNQVSSGGELTARYSLSKQNLLSASSDYFELRQTKAVSVGYLTEASWGLSLRTGKLNSSWHNFNPDVASYAESSSSGNRGLSERFFWGGFAVKARGYNAFLQGQFKDSAVTYSRNELNHIIFEAWAGYTQSFETGHYLSYGLRGHSSEVKVGEGNRRVVWGGLVFGKKWS